MASVPTTSQKASKTCTPLATSTSFLARAFLSRIRVPPSRRSPISVRHLWNRAKALSIRCSPRFWPTRTAIATVRSDNPLDRIPSILALGKMMNAHTQLETATGAEAPIALIDLKAQQARIRPNLDRAIQRVLDHGQYIMGPEVAELERRLAAFCGAKHAITCSSGTDALLISLMAMGIGRGDAVICPAFTYTATP